jgi:hypothetical protein
LPYIQCTQQKEHEGYDFNDHGSQRDAMAVDQGRVSWELAELSGVALQQVGWGAFR